MNLLSGLTIQAENPKAISEIDLLKIHEIEQDMWANGLGEYLKCECCGNIYSKRDIFGHLSRNIYIETVSSIERIIGFKGKTCIKCEGDMKHLWGEDYKRDIKEKFNMNKSFLTTIRNINGVLIGFSSAYIVDLETIYKREFEYYYQNIGLSIIKEKILNILDKEIPNDILMYSATGIEAKFRSIHLFLYLLFELFSHIKNCGYNNLLGIYEACIGSKSYSIYKQNNSKRLGISKENTDKMKILNTHDNFESDIFIDLNIIQSFVNLRYFEKL